MQATNDPINVLLGNWWMLLVRGAVALLFAVLAIVWPGITLTALVYLFGVYAFVDGVFVLWLGGVAAQANRRWWPFLLEGFAGIGAGVLSFVAPGAVALALVFLIAAWAIVTGLAEIVAAIELRKYIDGEWALGLAGILSVVFGILVAAQPGAGALALIWVIAGYALLFGITLSVLAFRVRGLQGRYQQRQALA
ncbi:MAG TPA: HdeD family acid-resistance protein [Chloroflexota bacterium]|jgi:uncharacterized membrane protein HdeD (DUF308 family)